jgi:hypothetical protein
MTEKEKEQQLQPPQQQKQQPGIESEMRPRPNAEDKNVRHQISYSVKLR